MDILEAIRIEREARANDKQYQALDKAWRKLQMKIKPGQCQEIQGNTSPGEKTEDTGEARGEKDNAAD